MSTMTEKRTRGRRPADTLATRLILLRHDAGRMSQRAAAERSGVPFGTWQGMELGRDTRGLADHIDRIADAFGYDREWLMWGDRTASRCTPPSLSVATSSQARGLIGPS